MSGSVGFGLGSWAPPDFKVDEIVNISLDATNACVAALSELLEIIRNRRIELGTPTL